MKLFNSYLVWGGISLYYAEMFQNMQRHRKLTEFLLNVTRSIFQDIVSMDTVIMKIMNYAQTLVDADRTSLFLVDNRTNELYARIFDIGGSKDEGCGRSCGDHEEKHSTLQMPTMMKDLIGRLTFRQDIPQPHYCVCHFHQRKMVNKKSGVFTASDEKSFQTFAIYCGLALHHAKLYDKIRRSEQKHRVALEVLSYHSKCSDNELSNVQELQLPEPYPSLESYKFDSYSLVKDGNDFMPSLVIQMTKNLFSLQRLVKHTAVVSIRFGLDELRRFVLTVKKNYRSVPYHNCDSCLCCSAFHALAMFFASLCHDLDHRGRTNSWMKNEQTPLAAVYSTSTMEHHHLTRPLLSFRCVHLHFVTSL
ncbi:hypothetical protein OS493_001050 [Desmophyllum pertusum]|uniref:PDEase domain-containing protein n=1 Tax=Desmophyllum pertusum TaxID=174260 RepID=A0A9W9ZTM9_9CNID|nr:hypothetical protein OS493_001050 [Desmophyllum pertusum]